MASLVAIPVYNEEKHLGGVLDAAAAHPVDVLVVDDGSTDGTPELLRKFPNVSVIRHARNRGYGAALRAAFDFGARNNYSLVITMDSDGQHEPSLIPQFVEDAKGADIVSGSRYLWNFSVDTPAPAERRRINSLVTDELNACFDLNLTDAFCGFKAYRVDALKRMTLTEDGYGMPLELWVEAACLGLRVIELPVPRVYLDPSRSFGEKLDDANARLTYYQEVIDRSVARVRQRDDCRVTRAAHPVFPKLAS